MHVKICCLHRAIKHQKYMYKFRVIFSAPLFDELTPKSWREGITRLPDLKRWSLLFTSSVLGIIACDFLTENIILLKINYSYLN